MMRVQRYENERWHHLARELGDADAAVRLLAAYDNACPSEKHRVVEVVVEQNRRDTYRTVLSGSAS